MEDLVSCCMLSPWSCCWLQGSPPIAYTVTCTARALRCATHHLPAAPLGLPSLAVLQVLLRIIRPAHSNENFVNLIQYTVGVG